MKKVRLFLFQLIVVGVLVGCFWNVGVVSVSAQAECEDCRKCCNYQSDCDCNETCTVVFPVCSEHIDYECKKNNSE